MHSISELIQAIIDGNISRSFSEEIKVYILIAAITLAITWNLFTKNRTKLLIILCVVASLNYARFGSNLLMNKIDSYDLMHYYINPKYCRTCHKVYQLFGNLSFTGCVSRGLL